MWKRKKNNNIQNNDEFENDLNWDKDEQINDQTYQQDIYADDLFLNEEKIQSKKKKPKDKEYYVKGSELKEEILKYQESKRKNAEKLNIPYEQAQGDISEALGSMIIKICTRFSMHPRFFRLFFQR